MTEESSRVEAITLQLLAAVCEAGYFSTGDGRISEQDAAVLIGFSCGACLKNCRSEGRGPRFHRAPAGHGTRISYAVEDLAAWLAERREP